MPELQHKARPLGMHGIDHVAPTLHLGIVLDPGRGIAAVALTRDERRLGDQQATQCRALDIVLRHRSARDVARHLRPHARQRREHDAVAEFERADADPGEKGVHERGLPAGGWFRTRFCRHSRG